MMRDPLVLLDYEIKRRPELAVLATDINQRSDAEIEQLDVLPWIRDALRRLKAKNRFSQILDAVMESTVSGTIANPMGVMREWIGPETFVQTGRTQLLVTAGTLIWIGRTGIWIDTIFSAIADPKIKQYSRRCSEISRADYITRVHQKRSGLTCATVSADKPLFQVFRPA